MATQSSVKSAVSPAAEPEVPVVHQQGNPGYVPTDFDHYLVLFPTRYATYVPAGLPAQSASGPAFGVLPTADGGKVSGLCARPCRASTSCAEVASSRL